MKKYCVIFEQRSISMKVSIVKELSLEDAVQFALNLHRSSNTVHIISVCCNDESGVVVSLELSKS